MKGCVKLTCVSDTIDKQYFTGLGWSYFPENAEVIGIKQANDIINWCCGKYNPGPFTYKRSNFVIIRS